MGIVITRFSEIQLIKKGGSIPVGNLKTDQDICTRLSNLGSDIYYVDLKKNVVYRVNTKN